MTDLGSPAALRLSAVTVRYGERVGLRAANLVVPPGQFLALTGPNGSGKSTLMHAVLGFLAPSEGTVELFGTAVASLSVRERARRVAWVPQLESPRDDVPLEEYVLYGRYAFHGPWDGTSSDERRAARELLGRVGLADRGRDGILSLSGGERQRATLARALAQGTPLVLLDEPTAHLDIGHQIDLLERVRELARAGGVTVVAALHDLNLAARYADRIVVLASGRVVADGAPRDVLSADLLARVWGVDADLGRDARTGLPYLVPHRLSAAPPSPAASPLHGPVHVVGGGGAAAPVLRLLAEEGLRVTAGALHLLDTDAEVAEALAIPSAVESPFAPLGEEVRRRNRELLAASRAIVVGPFAVGPANLANLEDVRPFVGHTPTFLLRSPPIRERDFCDGRGEAAYRALCEDGAVEVEGTSELLAALRSALEALPAPGARPDRTDRAGSEGPDLDRR